ncbi:CNVH-domain-containing protein [Rhizodiscina lignyota]|uniref:CNVH-domain-containing protein n=1 Tax=Rhizodiscina lignyota TaxID=1504668 RepID=A0A9P4ILX2_9PEZI|nr:CNVH-domain-containing protein [Rhizodiscina lignyota]
MTQLPNYGAGEGDNQYQQGYPPQNQYNQYPPYGQEQGQYQQSPPAGYGAPHGASHDYYGHQGYQGGDSYNQQEPAGYQQPYPQQQWYGGHAPQPYAQDHNSSYGSPPPPAPSYGSPPPVSTYGMPEQDRFAGDQPYPPHQGYPPQAQPSMDPAFGAPAGAPGMPPNPNEQDRGLLGAIGGAAAGGYAGHKLGGHGFIGALGGAYAGHKLEDHVKEERKKKKAEKKAQKIAMGRRGSSSSSSSSSSSDDDHGKQHHQQFRGNFSSSSSQMSLDKDYDLIASCSDISGRPKLSSISLNQVLTNDNGHFRWVPHGGNFGGSARHVRLENGGRVLVAELCNVDGHWREDSVWLDERIENSDGDLRFV